MTIGGAIYGVVLNDRRQQERLTQAFEAPPYGRPPEAPVVYIKPRLCATFDGAPIPWAEEATALELAPTLALQFAADAAKVSAKEALHHVGASCLALDVSIPEASFYRPAIAQRCRDGFLPLGSWGAPDLPSEIVTFLDGAEVHRWSLSRLVRPAAALIADLSAFMTLKAGDVLLVGLPGDAPQGRVGQEVRIEAQGMAALRTRVRGQA